MNEITKARHDLKSDVQNILSLLKFIKKDEEIKDPELRQLIDMAIAREESIIKNFVTLSMEPGIV